MTEYPTARLGDFCQKIGSGATPRGGAGVYLPTGSTALIRSQNVLNNEFSMQGLAYIDDEAAAKLASVTVEPGDVLLNITGDSVARCCSAPAAILPARVNQHVAIIRPFPTEFDAGFLRYFLVSPDMQDRMLKLANAGATRNALTKGMIESFQVPKPPIQVQRQIGLVLGSLDEKIRLLQAMSRTLDEIVRATFRALFVDFAPVLAKAKGATGFPGMTEDLFSALPTKLSEEGGQLAPVGWKVTPLSKLTREIRRGITPKYLEADGTCVLNQKCVRNGWISVSQARRHDSASNLAAERYLAVHDILVNSTGVGTLGRVAQVHHLAEPTLVDSHITIVRPNSKAVDPLYLGSNLLSRESEIEALAQGSTGQTELGRDRLAAIPVVIPPHDLQLQFGTLATACAKRRVSNQDEIGTLVALRDTIIPRIMSGELVISGGEDQLD